MNCPWAAKNLQGSCLGPVGVLDARETTVPGPFSHVVSREELDVRGCYRGHLLLTGT